MNCLGNFGDKNKQEIVALFIRSEPVQFLLADMLKGKVYSYNPYMKESIQDVVSSFYHKNSDVQTTMC